MSKFDDIINKQMKIYSEAITPTSTAKKPVVPQTGTSQAGTPPQQVTPQVTQQVTPQVATQSSTQAPQSNTAQQNTQQQDTQQGTNQQAQTNALTDKTPWDDNTATGALKYLFANMSNPQASSFFKKATQQFQTLKGGTGISQQ